MRRDEYSGRFLFHGTRTWPAIQSDDCLKAFGPVPRVSFSRDFNVAAYWASLPRGCDEECGSILVFDRETLNADFHLEKFVDDAWGGEDEHEEIVLMDVHSVSKHLVAVVPLPRTMPPPRMASAQRPRLAHYEVVVEGDGFALLLQDSAGSSAAVGLDHEQLEDLVWTLDEALDPAA